MRRWGFVMTEGFEVRLRLLLGIIVRLGLRLGMVLRLGLRRRLYRCVVCVVLRGLWLLRWWSARLTLDLGMRRDSVARDGSILALREEMWLRNWLDVVRRLSLRLGLVQRLLGRLDIVLR